MAVKSVIADVFKPASLDIDAMRNSEYWFKGGRGSTKSSFISIVIILGIMEDPNANAIIYRRVGNTIKDSVYQQMIWAIDTLGLSQAFKCKVSPFEITRIKTGQRILFRGADDPMKSKSIKLQRGYFKYLWFEELAEFRGMQDIRTIKQSVLRGVDRAVTLYSYNPPKSAQNWVNGESLKAVPGRYVHESTYLDVPTEWLGEAFITEAEKLRDTNELAYRNEYLGEVTGTGGNVFENVTVRDITPEEINSFGWFYQGIDWGWFPDEQPSPETKTLVEANLGLSDWSVDVVLSHTCPLKYEPVEVFLPFIDQSKVDKSTEEWFDSIEQRLTYDKWYCGHYHTEKIIDKLEFMYESIKEFK